MSNSLLVNEWWDMFMIDDLSVIWSAIPLWMVLIFPRPRLVFLCLFLKNWCSVGSVVAQSVQHLMLKGWLNLCLHL